MLRFGDERAGYQFGRKRATCAAYREVLIGQRPIRVVGDVESHGAIVVDRNPGASAGREAHERNEAIGREQSLGHTPVVSSLADYATGAVAEAVVGVVHYDLGRPVARLQPGIDGGGPLAIRRSRRIQVGVEERGVGAVDVTLIPLEVVGLLEPLRHRAVAIGDVGPLQLG